jgi:hypothetical protein
MKRRLVTAATLLIGCSAAPAAVAQVPELEFVAPGEAALTTSD